MKKSFFIYFFSIYYIKYSSSTLVDGIVTLSWSSTGSSPIVDRFLTSNTQIQLKIICREPTPNANVTREQTKKALNKQHENTKVQINGRIGRIVGCLPLQSDTFMSTNQLTKDNKDSRNVLQTFYDDLWKQMEQRTFKMHEVKCEYDGYLQVNQYNNITGPEISPEKVLELRKKYQQKNRRDVDEKQTPLQSALSKQSDKNLRTWDDGYYLIEVFQPDFDDSTLLDLDVDVVVSMKNRYDGYITADEHPALVFYAVMCGIYALFAVLWFIWCACYWRELLKIQFWIGGVILIGMIEKSAFVAEYDTVNRQG
jgi:hypothetical protein